MNHVSASLPVLPAMQWFKLPYACVVSLPAWAKAHAIVTYLKWNEPEKPPSDRRITEAYSELTGCAWGFGRRCVQKGLKRLQEMLYIRRGRDKDGRRQIHLLVPFAGENKQPSAAASSDPPKRDPLPSPREVAAEIRRRTGAEPSQGTMREIEREVARVATRPGSFPLASAVPAGPPISSEAERKQLLLAQIEEMKQRDERLIEEPGRPASVDQSPEQDRGP